MAQLTNRSCRVLKLRTLPTAGPVRSCSQAEHLDAGDGSERKSIKQVISVATIVLEFCPPLRLTLSLNSFTLLSLSGNACHLNLQTLERVLV